MTLKLNTLLSNYPYFYDGQFALENIQPALKARYLESIIDREQDFIKLSEKGFIHARILKWDTEYFGFTMARIEHFYFDGKELVQAMYNELCQWIEKNQVKHISVRLDLRNRTGINFLMSQGFEFITGKLMLRCDISNPWNPLANSQYTLLKGVKDVNMKELLSITTDNFNENRFVLDQHLDHNKSVGLYENWVQKEVLKNANSITLIRSDNSTLGFSLIDRLNDIPSYVSGFVNLIAVSKKHHGLGIGSILLKASLNQFKQYGVDIVYANIVSSNFASLSLFQSCGFKVYANLLELRKFNV